MANIIAVIWDFDKTLVNGYMQDPIFKEYKINPKEFWDIVNSRPDKYIKEQNVKVNKDTIYLNHFIHCANEQNHPLYGLNNKRLEEFGKRLDFYPGVDKIFDATQDIVSNFSGYKEYGIMLEHYIVSTGMVAMINGSSIRNKIKDVWGCELIEKDGIISEVGYTIDNTTKTRALFEINKGVNCNKELDVNYKIPKERRRVQFENMIYIADGPSDIPAFSVVKQKGGTTFAVYPHKDEKALKQVEQLRIDGRVDMYAEADYSEGTIAYMWLTNKIKEFCERIYKIEKAKFFDSISTAVPQHIV